MKTRGKIFDTTDIYTTVHSATMVPIKMLLQKTLFRISYRVDLLLGTPKQKGMATIFTFALSPQNKVKG